MENDIPVWPVQVTSTPPMYLPYQKVLIAPPDTTTALLDTFAFIGLPVTKPPKELYNLLHDVQCHRLLTPELASVAILVCLDVLYVASLLTHFPDVEPEPTCC